MGTVEVRGTSYHMHDKLKAKWDSIKDGKMKKVDEDRFYITDGHEGCLFENTLIKTNLGNKKIKELIKEKYFEVDSLNLKTNKKERGKAICIDSGIKELFEIETEDGRKVKATSEHKFFVMRDKKIIELKLSKLKEGDDLICH